MIGNSVSWNSGWSLRLSEANELSWNNSALMHQLVKTVLAIGSWFSKYNRTSVDTCIESCSILSDSFTVALHIKLLDMRWKFKQRLAIGKNGTIRVTCNMSIIEPKETK